MIVRYRHALKSAVTTLGSKVAHIGAAGAHSVADLAARNNRALCWRSMPPKSPAVAPADPASASAIASAPAAEAASGSASN